MSGVIGLKVFVLLIMGFYIVRAALKLPKWLGIGFLVLLTASTITIFLMAIYYPETLIRLAETLNIEIPSEGE